MLLPAFFVMKICTKCGIEKEEGEFYKRGDRKSGLRPECRVCNSVCRKNYRQNNPEKLKENNKKYRQNNLEKVKENSKNYRQNNPEKVKERSKKDMLELSDNYVAMTIRSNSFTGLKIEDIPKELIELKRNAIKFKREIKTKQNDNSTTNL
jgi:cytochrome c553